MSPLAINIMLMSFSVIAGAVIWHFVHGKVYAEIAVIKNDIANLKTNAASISLNSLVAAPAAPKSPAAPTTAAAANPTQRAS